MSDRRDPLIAREPGLAPARVEKHRVGERTEQVDDRLAVEAPLEIRVDGDPLTVTMRTPGDDRELAAGFLVAEGVLRRRSDLVAVETCGDPLAYDPDNVVEVTLAPSAAGRRDALERARREQIAVAACGLCGKARLEHVVRHLEPVAPPSTAIEASILVTLPGIMRRQQRLFAATGGIHAAALFSLDGELLAVREDVGRHNAVDKLVGAAFLADEPPVQRPWTDRILVVSARAGFEIVQKAAAAGVSVLAAVGAASSLAVDLARETRLDLWSFVRDGRANRHV